MGRIRETLKELLKSINEEEKIGGNIFYSVLGTVKSIDSETDKVTVTPNDGGAEIKDINILLDAETPVNGIVTVPAIGSAVIVTVLGSLSFITSLTELTSIDIVVPDMTIDVDTELDIDSDLIKFNGGEQDGMVLINDLLTKINRLEDKLKGHQHGYIPYPGGVAGPPVPTTPATAAAPPDTTLVFTNTTKANLENTKIKQ